MPKLVWTDEMVAIAAGMKRAGLPNKTIAARLGLTVGAVKTRLSEAGAKRRLDGHGGASTVSRGRITLNRVTVRGGEEA